MYPGSTNELSSNLYGNIPNMSLMFTMYAPTFGNYSFQIIPAIPGKTQSQFPTIPYLPLEALLYQNQSANPMSSPVNLTAGVAGAEQRIGGTSTMNDQFGTTRFAQGYQSG